MKTILRHIEKDALQTARQFRAVSIVGPRQSGKTTLSKIVFGEKPYVNLENPRIQALAEADTEGFLTDYKKTGAVFDEVQRVPNIFRYLQEILDNTQQRGKYILTGSNNFLLQEQSHSRSPDALAIWNCSRCRMANCVMPSLLQPKFKNISSPVAIPKYGNKVSIL